VGKTQDWQCFDLRHKNVLCFSLQGFFAAVKVYLAFINIEFKIHLITSFLCNANLQPVKPLEIQIDKN